ncbi:DUF885 domain-containing protein [Paraglaciecola sp. 2405UD69-4]|uniref:DUF885 domain-containing protein n=1 Tax=Paraglaciecola sp. 2405UD69-4 TaxID=3391836 RepID=UPI0039C9B552
MVIPNSNTIKILTLSILVSACSPAVNEPTTKVENTPSKQISSISEDERITQFFEDIFNENVASSPEYQTSLGIKTEDYGKWDDNSDQYYLTTYAQRIKNQLARLQANFDYQKLNETNQLSYDLFVFNSERTIANLPWYRHHYVVDQFNGQVTDKIAFIQNNHKIDNLDDAEAYIQRLKGIESVFTEFQKQLVDRAQFGVVTPEFSFPDMIKDISNLKVSEPSEHILYKDFSSKLAALDISQVVKTTLELEAEQAISGPFQAGVDKLITQLQQIQTQAKGNKGVWSLPNGEDFYKNRIKYHTTLDLTADEIHQIGLNDVERIHGQMKDIMKEVNFKGSLQEFFAFVRSDPNNFYEDSDAGREAFLAEARQSTADIFAIADQYFNKLPKASLEVRRVEPWRENSTSIAFYNRPSLDGSRPGRYYANLKDMKNLQKYVFSAITYHEGVPGHHFQIALAQELDGLPKFRKFGGYGAYTEGWALYAEQLAKEMGFYQNPMYNFGRLQDEIWRSVRLVTDTGIHAKKWTREQAIQYFLDNTPISEGDIVTEVERYFVNPGQALGYKLGMITILDLREKAKAALGDKFNIRDFHDVVIGTGALPLPILTKQVDKYIAKASQ